MPEENLVLLLRKALGVTQAKLAEMLEVSYSLLQQWEGGRKVTPAQAEKLMKLALDHRLNDLAYAFRGLGVEPEEAPPAFVAAKHQHLHMMLDVVMDSGYIVARALEENLKSFFDYVQMKDEMERKKS